MPREPPVMRAERPVSEKRSLFMKSSARWSICRRIRRARREPTPRGRGHGCCRAGATCTDAEDRLEQKWPQTLWIVRHGQSAGNVARDAAELGGLAAIDIADRDVDVPLSPLGEQQSDALGDWFAALPGNEQPQIVLSSPYVRARQTGDRVLAALRARGTETGGNADAGAIACVRDERLREKEFGILDRLTPLGIRARYPDLAEQRAHVGKFYFRPPGGESWCDVILRLRSFLDMLTREYRGDRVLVVCHQVIVNCLRYLLDRLDEAEVLALDRLGDVPNCGITSYEFDPRVGRRGKLVLTLENLIAPLRAAGAPVTAAPDQPVAAKS
jgi:broad specificity phosphatase PhoE